MLCFRVTRPVNKGLAWRLWTSTTSLKPPPLTPRIKVRSDTRKPGSRTTLAIQTVMHAPLRSSGLKPFQSVEYRDHLTVQFMGSLTPIADPDAPKAPSAHANINIDNFAISYQLWLWITDPQNKKKSKWHNERKSYIELPKGSSFVNLTMRAFKKVVAAACFYEGLPISNAVMHYENEGKLKWFYFVNGTVKYARGKKVELKSEEEFREFLDACADAGKKTMGLSIAMESPVKAAGKRQKESAVRSSLKRTNAAFVPSSGDEDGGGNTSEVVSSNSEESMDISPGQKLANAMYKIRQLLMTGQRQGETATYYDPREPANSLVISHDLLRLWAQDLINKVPGVDMNTPPLNRPEFKIKKQQMANSQLVKRHGDDDDQPEAKRRATSSCASDIITRVDLGHTIKVDLVEFLTYANITAEALVEETLAQLEELGIDHWSVFRDDSCMPELKKVGMKYGTAAKLIGAAVPYGMMLNYRAQKEAAADSGDM